MGRSFQEQPIVAAGRRAAVTLVTTRHVFRSLVLVTWVVCALRVGIAHANDNPWASYPAVRQAAVVDPYRLVRRPPPRVWTVKRHPADTFPFLPDEDPRASLSIGTVTDGWVVQARALPLPGRTYSVLPRQLRRGLLYGSGDMIDAIARAADEVDAQFPGSVLWIGNIGRQGGGDIPYSVSHNAGRDADLAFYVTDPSGRPVAPPDLLAHDDRGRSRSYGGWYRFDVARNWAVVRALATDPHVQVQFLFISNGLRALLLDYARSRGEDPALIATAGRLMRQPGAEIPHDDHLHIRLYCSRGDAGAGCLNSGAVHPGVRTWEGVREARVRTALSLLRSPEPQTRWHAVRRLAHLEARETAPDIAALAQDASPAVRLAVLEALAVLDARLLVSVSLARWEDETDARTRAAAVAGMASASAPEAVTLVSEVILRMHGDGAARMLGLTAVSSAGDARNAALVPSLVEALQGARDAAVVAELVRALRRITNHDAAPDPWSLAHPPERIAVGWRTWWELEARNSRRTWLDRGFGAAGYNVTGAPRDVAATLATAAGDRRRWVRENAQRELIRMTNNPARSQEWSAADARVYWTRWVRRNPSRVRAR